MRSCGGRSQNRASATKVGRPAGSRPSRGATHLLARPASSPVWNQPVWVHQVLHKVILHRSSQRPSPPRSPLVMPTPLRRVSRKLRRQRRVARFWRASGAAVPRGAHADPLRPPPSAARDRALVALARGAPPAVIVEEATTPGAAAARAPAPAEMETKPPRPPCCSRCARRRLYGSRGLRRRKGVRGRRVRLKRAARRPRRCRPLPRRAGCGIATRAVLPASKGSRGSPL